MSRRKHPNAAPHVTYGQLELRCPHGHPLGALVVTAMGSAYRLERPLADGKDVAAEPLVTGEKVKVLCPACRAAGRRPDYQAAWAVVEEHLADEQRDTRSDRAVLVLG
jgi:hypothetical protein